MSDWQLDRLPGDVRQEAESAAQRDGVPLHRWLGKLIRDTCADEGIAPSRELTRTVIKEPAGNGQRHQQSAPPRPPVEPIRIPQQTRVLGQPRTRVTEPPPAPVEPPQARAVEPPRPPVEPPAPAATPAGAPARAPTGRDTQVAHTPVLRASDLPRQPGRIAPTAPPATVNPPKLSTVSPAPRGMPPMPSTPPTPTPSRFSTEARSIPPRSRPEPVRAEPEWPPAPAAEPAAPPAATGNERQAALSKLVQGLRRNELSPVGEARTFLKLMTEHLASINDISIATGRTPDQISRSLRLLGLSDRLRDLIDRGALSREQAFALLDADDPDANPVVPPSSGQRS